LSYGEENNMGNMVEVDKLIWVDDMHGQYSVKSGYNKMINISRRGNDPRVKDKLNCLGKIHAAPKAKKRTRLWLEDLLC
jgi:hypothetical protein